MFGTSPDPLIVNAALTGMVPMKSDNANVPITPDEIAEDAARCREAGAAIVHLHAREADGTPTWRADVYAEIIRKVRERCPDVVVCVSTSGRLWSELEKRAEVLELEGDVKPEMASLTLGSLNFPGQASVNEPSMILDLAERMYDRGIMPELEVFDFGMVDFGRYLLERGVLRPPSYFNLLLGSLGTLSASPAAPGIARASAPGRVDMGRGGHRTVPVRRERPGDRVRRPRSRRPRGQPLARRRQGATRDERRPGRAARHTGSSVWQGGGDPGAGTRDDRPAAASVNGTPLPARGEHPRDRVDHALAGAPVDLADHLARDAPSLLGELSRMRERPLDTAYHLVEGLRAIERRARPPARGSARRRRSSSRSSRPAEHPRRRARRPPDDR